nr:hypothetical protein [uncultured Holophaga sp.]
MSDQIPTSLTAGASLSLILSFSAYLPSAGWALRWTLQGPGTTRVSVEGAASGDAWSLDLTPAQSLLLLGRCPWQLWMTKDSQSIIVGAGALLVEPGAGTVRKDEQILEALEDALLRLAADDEAEVWISDRKLVFKDPAKIQKMIGVYRARIRAARGGSAFTAIPVRFL